MAWYRSTSGRYVQAARKPGPAWRTSGPPPQTTSRSGGGYVGGLPTREAEDRARQLEREQGGIAELREAIALFDEDYGKGAELRAMASASSQLISSGLGGTTRPGAVSAGMSAEFEDLRRGRLSTAMTNLANFFGTYRDPTMVTPGTVLQGIGQEQQYALGQGQLALSAARSGGGGGQPTFTPGPVNLASTSQPQTTGLSTFDKYTSFGGDSGTGGRAISPYTTPNAKPGGTLQDASVFGNKWYNWEDPLSFEGLNFG